MRGTPDLSRRSRRSSVGRLLVAFGLTCAGAGLALLPAGAQTASSNSSTAAITTDAWWGTPSPLPSSVPNNAIAVAARGGERDKIAALGLSLFVASGETLTSVKLRLKESGAPGANYPVYDRQIVNIVACPITSIYSPEHGGNIANAPTYDCEVARADGTRAADGIWTFDITSLAELWASSALEAKGLILVERVDAPRTFQWTFEGLASGMITLELETMLDELETTTTTETTIEEEEFPGTPAEDNFFTDLAESNPGSTDTPVGIVENPPTTAAPPPTVAGRRVADRRPTKGELPLASLLLVPFGAGLALVGGMSLGPAGDPATVHRREGGLSRALNRRRASPFEEAS